MSSFNAIYNSPLHYRCRNWVSKDTRGSEYPDYNKVRAAYSFVKRSFGRIKDIDLNNRNLIEEKLPDRFTKSEREAGLNEAEHLDDLRKIAIEFLELMTKVEKETRAFVK